MGELYTRRRVLAGAALGFAAVNWSRVASAQPQAGPLELTDLGDDLVSITGAGANVAALATSEGVLLVDGGTEAGSAALMRALAERWPGRPLKIVFNTNWREEHTGGNAAAHASGA